MQKHEETSITDASNGSGNSPEIEEQTKQAEASNASWPSNKYTGPDIGRDPREGFGHGTAEETDNEGQPGLFSPEERAELEAIMSPAAINELEAGRRARQERRSKTKKNIPRSIIENAADMIAEAGNKPLHSAKGVGVWLIARGLHEPVRGSNAFGDALGGHGLRLPYVVVGGRRYYDLRCVGMTDEEKQQRQALLRTYEIDVLRSMIAD